MLNTMFEDIREQGFAVNNGELDAGIFSAAAPVLLQSAIVGAIALVLPSPRAEEPNLQKKVQKELLAAAERLANLLV